MLARAFRDWRLQWDLGLLLTKDDLLNYPFETLTRFDHVNNQGPLEEPVVVWHILVEFLVASTGPHHEIPFHFKVNSGRPNKIQLLFYM
jgi:hypothetical protein